VASVVSVVNGVAILRNYLAKIKPYQQFVLSVNEDIPDDCDDLWQPSISKEMLLHKCDVGQVEDFNLCG
jgi:hypothetical protein